MNTKAYVRGLGFYVPERIMTNKEFESFIDTSDEWIRTRTGIRERHIAADDQTCSDLAYEASRKALQDAGMQAEELTHIILPTLTPDYVCPSAAVRVGHKLGIAGNVTALDINAACSGFIYSLQLVRGFINMDPTANILVCPSEILTSRTNWQDRSTCVLFGDGSGAAVISGEPGDNCGEIEDVVTGSDGALAELLTIRGGGSTWRYKSGEPIKENFFIEMVGNEVFKHAVRSMEATARDVMQRNNLKPEDIDLLVPHQANVRIMEVVAKKLEIPVEKVFINVDHIGNTSAASVPIALAEAKEQSRLTPGTKVLLVSFGGGFTWGASIVQF